MANYTTIDVNSVTGEVTIIPWTQEQIDAYNADPANQVTPSASTTTTGA